MKFLRKWATPWTIGSFLLMSVTGILMFYHLNSPLNKLAHEWLSFAFLAGVVIHVYVNWLAFSRYFKSPVAIVVMLVFAVLLGASFVNLGGARAEPPQRAILAALGRAPLTELAPVVHDTPDALVARLRAKGFAVASSGQSADDIAGKDKKTSLAILAAAFARDRPDQPRADPAAGRGDVSPRR